MAASGALAETAHSDLVPLWGCVVVPTIMMWAPVHTIRSMNRAGR